MIREMWHTLCSKIFQLYPDFVIQGFQVYLKDGLCHYINLLCFGGDRMKKNNCIIFLQVVVFFSLLMAATAFSEGSNSVFLKQVTFRVPELKFVTTNRGMLRIEAENTGYLIQPGSPRLPEIIKFVELPSYVPLNSVTLTISSEKSGSMGIGYELEPSPPLVLSEQGLLEVNWGKSGKIRYGKDISVYFSSTPYPKKAVEIKGWKIRGKKRYVKLAYYPVRYYPLSGKIELVDEVVCQLNATAVFSEESTIGIVPDQLPTYSDSQTLSRTGSEEPLTEADSSYDYIIITTNETVTNSQKLTDFIHLKEAMGHKVLVVTQDQYSGVEGQAPDGRAEKIRQWLKNNYESMGIRYVLLIGDPDPTNGDIPMKKCYPRSHESDHQIALTDYYYADLSGNWDLDGDGLFGEYPDDIGPGGVDYSAEVWVGRIPVYNNDYQTLDSILQKIIDYETDSGDISWRKKALLPAAILNFQQEPPSEISRTDGAELAQKMISDYLGDSGFIKYSLYEKEGVDQSTYNPDAPLTRDNVKDSWATGYGVVCAVGHGSQTGIYRKYWRSDDNSDGIADGNETVFASFFTSNDTSVLDNTHPSIVYLCACNNGYPENSGNLGYTLLKKGAIATVSASRVSWYTAGWTKPNPNYGDNFSIGYYYLKYVTEQNMPCGEALAMVKEMLVYDSATISLNLQCFNLYGDPETTLTGIYQHCAADFDLDNDVDGMDLSKLASGKADISLSEFAAQFGNSNCTQ